MPAFPDLKTFSKLAAPGRSIPIRAELPADTETPVSAFLKLADRASHAFLFESVEGGERVGRWSFIGARPRRVFTWNVGESPEPLLWVQGELARWTGVPIEGTPRFPGGLVGYIGYDAVQLFEPRVPLARPDELGFPAALLMDFDTVVAFDGLLHRAHVIAEARVEKRGARAAYEDALRRIERTTALLRRPLPRARPRRRTQPPRIEPRIQRAAFEASVSRAKELICAGDCQQIVVSQRFDARTNLPPFEIYRALRRINPSPYLFYLQAGENALIGSSPEMLIRVEAGEVTVRPIAGTRPRGATPEEDALREAELRADEKENAEHVMLVDLGRNDVGRVAQLGTVRVSALKTVERYSHVMHLVSEVRGKLAEGKSALDALRAAFPAGTVTGAPKVRAMEIIDSLEPARRGPYAGCVGWFDRYGNLETCIAIRTLFRSGARVSAQAGAGVVYDSTPSAEYQETLHKARALFAALEAAGA